MACKSPTVKQFVVILLITIFVLDMVHQTWNRSCMRLSASLFVNGGKVMQFVGPEAS